MMRKRMERFEEEVGMEAREKDGSRMEDRMKRE